MHGQKNIKSYYNIRHSFVEKDKNPLTFLHLSWSPDITPPVMEDSSMVCTSLI